MPSSRHTLLAALVAALAVACSSAPPEAPAVDASGPPAADTYDFTSTTLDGATFDAASLAGEPAILWFWAPWCVTCRGEAPDVSAVAAEFDGDVEVIGVSGRGQVNDMQQFVAETGTGALTHLADVDGAVWSRFGIVSQPAFVFLDADGRAESFTGAIGEDRLRAAAETLAS